LASNHSYNNADAIAAQIKKNAAADSNQTSPDTSSLCTDPEAWLTSRGYVTNMKSPDLTTRTGEYENACSKYPKNVNSGDRLKTVATVGFVVGGVAAVGTVIYYFLDSNAQESAKEAGVARFDFLQQKDDPTRIVLYEVYRDAEAPVAHKQSAHYNEWAAKVEDMFVAPRTRAFYSNVAPGDEGF
jgi:quinol monooxygenase YgiN